MIRFAIALLVGGAVLTFFGYSEHKLASSADATPQSITAADFIANGAGDNANVTLTDAYILESYYAFYYEDKPSELKEVFIPIIAMDDPWVANVQKMVDDALERNPNNPDLSALMNLQAPDSVKVVLQSDSLKSEGAVESFAEKTEFTGLVVSKINTLDKEVVNGLKQLYPTLDTSGYLIEHNRKPKSTGTTMLMMVGGVVLMLAGPGLFFIGRNK